MDRPIVKLMLDVDTFDETPFILILDKCRDAGICFETLGSLGDSPENRLRLYELNKICSEDIPGRGAFFSYDEFLKRRFGQRYDPAGVILALEGDTWTGMAATSNWSHKGFMFNEMTGVLRQYRRRGIALALKLLGIRFAKDCNVSTIYTIHDAENVAATEMNRRLGYVDTE